MLNVLILIFFLNYLSRSHPHAEALEMSHTFDWDQTELTRAVKAADLHRVRQEFESSRNQMYECGGNDATLLHFAARENLIESMKVLIQVQASLETGDADEDMKPLAWAALHGNADAVVILLNAKADVNAHDNCGNIAIYYAEVGGHENVVRIFKEYKPKIEGMAPNASCDIASEKITVLAADQNQSSDVNVPRDHPDSNQPRIPLPRPTDNALLQNAANTRDFIKAKLARIREPDIPDNSVSTLVSAAVFGRSDVLQVLLKNKELLETRYISDQTLLMITASRGYVDATQVVIDAGANLETCDQQGNTALALATANGHLEVMERLIAAKASISVKNELRQSQLDLAGENAAATKIQLPALPLPPIPKSPLSSP